MRYIFLLTLLAIASCENDDPKKDISFSGQVIDADSPDKISLQGIKIDLQVPISPSQDSIINSTITNSNGRYFFTVKDLNERFELYKVEISDEYYKRCIELLTPDMTTSGHKTINRNTENVWDLNACLTGVSS